MQSPRSSSAVRGETLFLSHLNHIERILAFVAVENRLAAADADDFASHVKLKFVENDYALLQKFGGRSSVRTFLSVVIHNLFSDYRDAAWGKWRPSAEARRRGPIAQHLERLLSRDRVGFEEACELLAVTASRPQRARAVGGSAARTSAGASRQRMRLTGRLAVPTPSRPSKHEQRRRPPRSLIRFSG